ncbi:MAG: alpha/beta hydrolase [Rhodospirillales bacterium]|nr:alpha/beta hydrolase [Rhodospirillales bacterium]
MDESRFVAVDGVSLEYRWIGPQPGETPTLVFLHEGLGSVSLWRDFPDRLAAATGLGALVYSRQGYGRSAAIPLPRPLSYHRDEGQRVLPALLDALHIRRAIPIGHSDGASIALAYMSGRAYPHLLGGAVMAPHVTMEEINLISIREAVKAFETGDLRERLKKHHGDNVDGAFLGWSRAWLDPNFLVPDLCDLLPEIRVPLMVLQGENDEYGTAEQYETILGKVSGSCEVVVLPACRHSPHKDQPEMTLAALVRFVKSLLI